MAAKACLNCPLFDLVEIDSEIETIFETVDRILAKYITVPDVVQECHLKGVSLPP
jgi:hypothetical protein